MACKTLTVSYTLTMTQQLHWDEEVPMTEENILCNLEPDASQAENDMEITSVKHKGEEVEYDE